MVVSRTTDQLFLNKSRCVVLGFGNGTLSHISIQVWNNLTTWCCLFCNLSSFFLLIVKGFRSDFVKVGHKPEWDGLD